MLTFHEQGDLTRKKQRRQLNAAKKGVTLRALTKYRVFHATSVTDRGRDWRLSECSRGLGSCSLLLESAGPCWYAQNCGAVVRLNVRRATGEVHLAGHVSRMLVFAEEHFGVPHNHGQDDPEC